MPASSQHEPTRSRARRRDAEQNRATILAAARAAFAERGVAAGVDHIARRAGVGPATLYRHFPSKAELVDAVLEEGIRRFVDLAKEAAKIPDAAEALREMIHRIVDEQIADRSFLDLMVWHNASSPNEVPALEELGAELMAVVGRAREDGVLRADAAFSDVMLVLIALDGLSGAVGENWPHTAHRIAEVAVDGLLSGDRSLAGKPLEDEELPLVMAAGRVLPERPPSN